MKKKYNKKLLLKLRHTINPKTGHNWTLRQLGNRFDISGERVRQIIGNTGSVRNTKKEIKCKSCGKKVLTFNTIYCSRRCFAKDKRLYTNKPLSTLTKKEKRDYWKRKRAKLIVNTKL